MSPSDLFLHRPLKVEHNEYFLELNLNFCKEFTFPLMADVSFSKVTLDKLAVYPLLTYLPSLQFH